MSEHGRPDESGIDRLWLSSLLVLVALLIGAMSWNEGKAAPRPRIPARLGPQGVVVLKDGQGILRGTVLESGGNVKVVTRSGEQAIPRNQVHWHSTESDDVPAEKLVGTPYKPEQARGSKAKASKRKQGGTVILHTGQIYVGWLTIDKHAITIRWPYKQNRTSGSVSVPRRQIRWFKAGADGPTGEYWKQFPRAYLQNFPGGPGAPRKRHLDPAVTEAELNQNQGAWPTATRLWAEVYRTKGFKEAHLHNLRTCVRSWLKRPGGVVQLENAIRKIDKYVTGMTKRPEIRNLLGDALMYGAEHAMRRSRRKTAREFAKRMVELGGKYQIHGKRLQARIRGEDRPPVRKGSKKPGHEGHDHD